MLKKLIIISIIVLAPLHAFSQNLEREDDYDGMADYIRGITALNNSEFSRALEYLNSAYRINPESSGISYALSDVHFALDDYDSAAHFAREAISLEPENKWFYLKLSNIYRKAGQHRDALDALVRAKRFHPDDSFVLLELAGLHAEFRDFEASNNVYDEILAMKGADIEIFHYKYLNYMKLNKPDKAIEELYLILHLEPDNLNTVHTISRLYIEFGELDEALELLQEALERNARNPETLILLAEIYIKEGRWENLGSTFVSLIADPLFSADQKMELARFLYLQHQTLPDQTILAEQTRRVLESFSENEPEHGEAHLLAAEFYLRQNETAPAIEMLELANHVMPEESEAWRQRLQLLFSGGDYQEVIRVGTEADRYVHDDAIISFFIGTSYMLTDQYDKAAERLENATLMPSRRIFRSVIFTTLADVLAKLERGQESVKYYEDALRLDSTNHNAMNNYAFYMAEREERLDHAKELSLAALQYEPENPAYLDTAGWIFYKKAEYEVALEYILAAVETGNASAGVYEHAGDVYEKLGQLQKAQTWWGRALEADPGRNYLENKVHTP